MLVAGASRAGNGHRLGRCGSIENDKRVNRPPGVATWPDGRLAHGAAVVRASAMYWIGTSGYNYLEWRGTFYPANLPASRMLPYYAARFSSVEINYSFYRIPTEKMLAGWAAQTPDRFKLTLKAPRRITHVSKLRNSTPLVSDFCATAATLGSKLGVLLFQLPPFLQKDLLLLDEFLGALPAGVRVVMEFRHASWLDDDVLARLRARGVALCIADSERMTTPVVMTAAFGYFRLRDEGYTPESLEKWAATIRAEAARLEDVFIYFKHEEAGRGPEFARTLRQSLEVTEEG
jgi:uncharacterized protein YecE (DUF72 family)